jgi:LmbE family N-acetylglucosaminyl deacetylase
MTRRLSILNVGGHPKDVILYAGGTMAMHVENGDRVCALTPTHGLSHHQTGIADYERGIEVDRDALIAERKQELIEAAGELGVTDVRFLGHDDEIPLPKEEIVNDIADVIGEVRPDIIVTHWPHDSVEGHANATRMVLLALEATAGMREGRSYAPHSPKQVFFHTQRGRTNVLERGRPVVPTTVIDITSVIHKKSNAMNRFRSQFYGEESPLQRKLSESLDGSIDAIHVRVPYSESFVAMDPEVHRLLPLSDYALEIADKTEADRYAYMTQMLLDP